MCEIMTVCAAIVFTLLYTVSKKKNAPSMQKTLLFATFMFWGAALMWSVDGIASVIEGEPFFDISRSDTILGFIILGTGLSLFGISVLIQKLKTVR